MQKITHLLMHCSRKILEEKKEKKKRKKREWSLHDRLEKDYLGCPGCFNAEY